MDKISKTRKSISAIVTTYNRAETIEKCLAGIIKQTQPVDEVIIVDDGGTDNTEQVVKEYSSQTKIPIRYFYQDNRGCPAARNQAILLSQSDYVAGCDDDDIWHPRHIEWFLQSNQYLSSDVLAFGGLISRDENYQNIVVTDDQSLFDSYNKVLHSTYLIKPQSPLKRPFYTPSFSTSVVTRELALKVAFDADLLAREDFDFFLEAVRGLRFYT